MADQCSVCCGEYRSWKDIELELLSDNFVMQEDKPNFMPRALDSTNRCTQVLDGLEIRFGVQGSLDFNLCCMPGWTWCCTLCLVCEAHSSADGYLWW